jgi:hypothetical protein
MMRLITMFGDIFLGAAVMAFAVSLVWYHAARAWARQAARWRSMWLTSEQMRAIERREHAAEIARWQAGGPYR